jgi:transcriptional regulator with XRE-family HTH domain
VSAFAACLKTWRKSRRFSQLQLALEADVSARHIAFLETGRARPSVEMVSRLGDALRLPLAARNQLLTTAGFAVRYPGTRWDGAALAPIREAVDYTLLQHAPYPGLAVDRLWTVLRLNDAAARLFSPLGVEVGTSMLDLLVSDVLPPLVENWPEVAHHAVQRLRTESAAQGGVDRLDAVAAHLARDAREGPAPLRPVVPTVYRLGAQRLSLFATIAQFGTPEDVTLDDVKVELYFPADAETKAALQLSARSGLNRSRS